MSKESLIRINKFLTLVVSVPDTLSLTEWQALSSMIDSVVRKMPRTDLLPVIPKTGETQTEKKNDLVVARTKYFGKDKAARAERDKAMVELREQGLSVREIARRFDLNEVTASKLITMHSPHLKRSYDMSKRKGNKEVTKSKGVRGNKK